MKADARSLLNHTIEVDVCVIGSGPAGLALAHEFIGRGVRVLVLESGSDRCDPGLQSLCGGTSVGDAYSDLALTRHRRIGGTPHIWSTRIGDERAAKYVPLDPIDFEPRPWLPLSGWPFARATLDPYYM